MDINVELKENVIINMDERKSESLLKPESSPLNEIKTNSNDDVDNEVNDNENDGTEEPIKKKLRLNGEAQVNPPHYRPLRQFKRIPIFIVDYHNDVLEFIYRALATRHLPFENNTLVHFDSHPDMVISRDIPASASYDKERMLAELSIENWIMPVCYTGHFKRVIWIKNSWCRQMPVGKYKFKIGHKNDKICVDCPLDYFISEGNYCVSSELRQARDMELDVINADSERPPDPKLLLMKSTGEDYNQHYILDIDLDFFSTSNPFLEIYKDALCYDQLTAIFHFDSVTEIAKASGTTEKRKQQLDALKCVFEHLEERRSLHGLYDQPDKAAITAVLPNHIIDKIKMLCDSLQKCYADDEIDWLLIYESGSTIDTNGLPHHISTEQELELYYKQFKEFLLQLPRPPVLITMACSAEDDYCPRNQVARIQERVLKILKDVFQEKLHEKPILHYMFDEWDIMDL